MSILEKGEVDTIICNTCKTKFNFACKNNLYPEVIDFDDITCSECIEIIKNIKLEESLTLFQILKDE